MPDHLLPGILRILKGVSFRILFFNVLIVSFAIYSFVGISSFERLMLTELEINLNEQARGLSNSLGWQRDLKNHTVRKAVNEQPWAYRSFVQVFDKKGVLIYQSNPSQLETKSDPSLIKQKSLYKLATGLFGFFSRQSSKAQSSPLDLQTKEKQDVANALQGRPAVRAIRNGFEKADVVIVSTFPIRTWKTPIGAVRVHSSANRVLTAVYQFRWSTIKITLVLVLGTIILNIILSRTILKPIKRLTTETRTILQFKDPRKIDSLKPITGFDEIKQLSLSLSHLTAKLTNEVVQHKEFVDDLVHEMNNPLTAIRSSCEMFDLAENQNDKQRFHQMIVTNVSRIEKLLSSVKDLNHITCSSIEQQPPPVDIGGLTKQYVENTEQVFSTTLELNVNRNEALMVCIDKARYIQLLDNLVQNAVSFSPPSESIQIEIEEKYEMITLKVKDRGIGISSEHITRIFDRFFSLRRQNQSRKHSGLGLAIAKSIAENNGGQISAMNNPKGGSCFEVNLPVA